MFGCVSDCWVENVQAIYLNYYQRVKSLLVHFQMKNIISI